MTRIKEIYVYQESGRFWVTDQYDLVRVAFPTAEARQLWLHGYYEEVGAAKIIEGKPNIMANLQRGNC